MKNYIESWNKIMSIEKNFEKTMLFGQAVKEIVLNPDNKKLVYLAFDHPKVKVRKKNRHRIDRIANKKCEQLVKAGDF